MDVAKKPRWDETVILEPIPLEGSDTGTEFHQEIPDDCKPNKAELSSAVEKVNGANEMDAVEPLPNAVDESNGGEQHNGAESKVIDAEVDAASDDDSNNGNGMSFLSLNEDCFGEIFDWLSSNDVKSLGSTCKSLNRLCVTHFQRKYPAKRLKIRTPLKYKRPTVVPPQPTDFLKLYRTVYLHDSDLDIFTFLAEHCKTTLDKLQFGQNTARKCITSGLGIYIKDQLERVAAIDFIGCRIDGELYQLILQYCSNLKQLSIRIFSHEGKHIGSDDTWLQKKYSNLEHLALVKTASKIDQLKRFFERNSKVTSFTTTLLIVMANKSALRSADLDDLGIEIGLDDQERLEDFTKFINKLHDGGQFRRLKLRITDACVLIENIDAIVAMKGLVALYFDCDVKISEVFIEALTSLNQLEMVYIRQPIFEDTDKGILWKGIVNVRQLFIQRMKCADFATEILQLIQHSSKIRKIHIRALNGTDFELNTAKAAKERNKLRSARKVNVFVDEASYLHIKWTNDDIVLDSLEVKRSEADLTKHPFMLHDDY